MTVANVRLICSLGAVLAAWGSCLAAPGAIGFRYETNRANQLFRPGEEAVITVTATNGTGGKVTEGVVTARLDNYGPKILSRTQVDLSKTNPFVVKGRLDEPGFLRLKMSGDGVKNAGANWNSRWAVGYAPELIRAGGTCPADFDAFWKAARENLAATVPLDPRLELQPDRSKGAFDFYRVSFATVGGARVWGFLSVPKDKSKAPFPATFEVTSAGEGLWTIDMQGRPDRIYMYFTVHPFDPPRTLEANKKRHAELRAELKARTGVANYAASGLDGEREDYYFYRTILGIDRAVDWLWARPDVDRTRFDYSGGSQGGYFGWMLTALNHRFTSAFLRVPAGSDTRGSLAGRESGWPKPLGAYRGEKLAVATRNAGYYDGASFAPRITCPVCVTVGFVDDTCPPSAVYATYNLLGSSERYALDSIGKGHGGHPLNTVARDWQEVLRHLGHAPRVAMPPDCTNPDGLAVTPDGRLAIAAPNNDRRRPGAVFRLDAPGRTPVRWFDVPVTSDTGFAAPMGICFGPAGELYVCDNQPDSKGRLLRLTLAGDGVASCEIVAEGLENANGVKFLNGKLYLTQAFQTKCVRPDGTATSALYMFDAKDRNVRVANTAADPQRVFTDTTANRAVRGGLNGVAVSKDGLVYAGNYGDGRIWRLTPGPDGRIAKAELFAEGLVSADGLCTDGAGNLYCADMLGSQAVRFAPDGRKTVLAKDCYVKPSEPCVWKGALYVSDYASTTLTVCRP